MGRPTQRIGIDIGISKIKIAVLKLGLPLEGYSVAIRIHPGGGATVKLGEPIPGLHDMHWSDYETP